MILKRNYGSELTICHTKSVANYENKLFVLFALILPRKINNCFLETQKNIMINFQNN